MEYLIQFYAIYGSVINFIGINALLALSLNVTLAAGMLSMGNAAFAAVGGYTAGILSVKFGLSYVVSLAVGSVAAGVVGLVIGLPVLRLRGVFLAMATLAFGEVVRLAAVNLDITGGAEGLTGIPNITETWMIYLVLAATAYFIAVLRAIPPGMGAPCHERRRDGRRFPGNPYHLLQGHSLCHRRHDRRPGWRYVRPSELPDYAP